MAKRTYTTSEAAKEIAVSRETIYVWLRGGMIPQPKQIKLGKRTFFLWTDADISAAKKFKSRGGRG